MESTTPKSVLVGFEKLQTYLEKQTGAFDAIKVANNHNDKTNWRKEFNNAKSGENIPALIEYLQEWSPQDVPYTWYICLFKNKIIVERLPFSKLPVTQSPAVAGIPANMISIDFANQLAEARERAAVAEYQMSEMAKQIQDDEDDEDDQPDYVGKIVEQVVPYMPVIIEGLVGMITKNQKPLQVAGVPDDASEYVEILLANGVKVDHLKKLADMAVNNKAKFKSLLMML